MNPVKIRHIKWLISKDDYYRNRAIQMGELMGTWIAELSLSKMQSKEYYNALKKRNMYSQRLLWYIKKYRSNNYDEIKDFNTQDMILNILLKIIIATVCLAAIFSLILIIWAGFYVHNGGEINISYDREDKKPEEE